MHINIVDYIIIAILVLSALNGFKQGFFVSLGRMASAVLAIGLAFFYRHDFILYLDNKFDVINIVAGYLNQKIPILAAFRESTLLSFIVPSESITELTKQLTSFLIEPAAILLLFFIAFFLFSLLFLSLNHLVSGRYLGGINGILGMVIVISQNLLITIIVLGIIMPPLEFAARIDIMGAVKLYHYLQDSWFANYLIGFFENLKAITGKYA
ncbi:MAG: CvpA family protein [Syntrophomonadaceae bacterium]|nr:CvpA family protein [Syntrophomonadaceae bacterium]